MSDFFKPNFTFGSILQAGGNIISGISGYQSSLELASDYRYQGELTKLESFRSANIIREEGIKFAAEQSLQYIGSGVQLMGSALITIAQTKKYAETEAKAVEERGKSAEYLAERRAAAAEDEGRASLLSGILGGIGSFF